VKIINKKVKFNYQTSEKYEGGLVLTGAEVVGLRQGRANLTNAHIKLIDNELYLVNLVINSQSETLSDSRKILMHRSEITSLVSKSKAKKLILVPMKLYNKGRLIKLEIALGKPKRRFEKKDVLKQRDIQRDIERELK
jgi:SsrA-binding protein